MEVFPYFSSLGKHFPYIFWACFAWNRRKGRNTSKTTRVKKCFINQWKLKILYWTLTILFSSVAKRGFSSNPLWSLLWGPPAKIFWRDTFISSRARILWDLLLLINTNSHFEEDFNHQVDKDDYDNLYSISRYFTFFFHLLLQFITRAST